MAGVTPGEQLASALAAELGSPAMAATMGPALTRLLDRGLWHLGPTPKPSEAEELWTALELGDGDQVESALLIGKIVNFKKGGPPNLSVASTDDVDWVDETGLLHAAIDLKASQGFSKVDDE